MHLKRYLLPATMFRRLLFLAFILLVLTCNFDALPAVSNLKETLDARQQVQAAWEQARGSGSYEFTADVIQHTIPAATVTNAGRRSRQDAMHLEGRTDLRQGEMSFTLWSQGGSVLNAQDGVQVKVEGDRSYIRRGEGGWEEVGDLTGTFAPQGDYLVFLNAATDITHFGEETRAGVSFTRYSFAIDGPSFAAYVRDQLQVYLTKQGELPPGVTLDLPRVYADMTGSGELWVGVDGLPLRQLLWLRFPEQNEQRIDAEISVDFSNFGLTATVLVAKGKIFFSSSWVAELPLYTSLLGLAILFFIYRRTRIVQTALALVLTFSMAVTPVLQSNQAAAFSERQATLASEGQARQEDAQELQERLWSDPFDPQTDPLTANKGQMSSSQISPQFPADHFSFPVTLQSTALVNGVCDLHGSPLTAQSTDDSDNDGLTDYQECLLGTDPLLEDSDGDRLSDRVEVVGFEFAGERWYSDPLFPDSNRDGLVDTTEWWANAENDLPGDTDQDDTPDLFDDDNDGDGVRDQLDLSPFQGSGSTYTRNEPLSLVINGLTPSKPTFVEFQLRPANRDQLWYAFNVLDWPQGDDQAQMQDIDGATFASATGASDLTSENGDLRLIPMLEIFITGEQDNLPPSVLRNTNIKGEPILDIYGNQVLRTVYPDLEPYGIYVSPSGDGKTVYIPLQLVTDSQSGERQAFYGKMLYAPDVGWGNAQLVRLVWMVQALVDNACVRINERGDCLEGANNQLQVIHTYYEDWTLTGLNVREEHGSNIAILYEDPADDLDPENDAGLIGLAAVLDRTFLAGADEDGDGKRDFVVSHESHPGSEELDALFAEGNFWGLPGYLRMVNDSYETSDIALKTIIMEQSKAILEEAFANHTEITPTLMFAREDRSRALNIDEACTGGLADCQSSSLVLQMGTNRPVKTEVSLTWAPYHFVNDAWEGMPIEDYSTVLAGRYMDDPDPASASPEALVRLMAVYSYYMGLYGNVSNVVQSGDQLIPSTSPQLSDQELRNNLFNWLYKSGASPEDTASYAYGIASPDIPLEVLAEELFSSSNRRLTFVREFGDRGARDYRTSDSITEAQFSFGLNFALIGTSIAELFTRDEKAAMVLTCFNLTADLLLSFLDVIDLAMSVSNAVSTALSEGKSVMKAIRGTLSEKAPGLKASAIGLIIDASLIWGTFIYQVIDGDIAVGSPEFFFLLAGTVAALIVASVCFALSLNPYTAILLAIIGLVDSILNILCVFGVTCFSILGTLTEKIAWLFYDYAKDVTVEFSQIWPGPISKHLENPEMGYASGNYLVFNSIIDTWIKHKAPSAEFDSRVPDRFFDDYWNEGKLRSSRVNYAYNQQPPDVQTPWFTRPATAWDGWLPFWTAVYPKNKATGKAELQAGINFRPAVQLVVSYDFPGVECERILFWWDCDNFRHRDKSVENIDMVVDVFPSDLDEFYSLGAKSRWDRWDLKFGLQRDFDGDGLLSIQAGGVDPDDFDWDTDGDGLADGTELALREQGSQLFLGNPDSDSDGLQDGQEIRLGTDPGQYDSDGDGLGDAEEVQGWAFSAGTGLMTWVTSDPLVGDTDGDGMSDAAEKDLHQSSPETFPYHPRVFNTQPIALFTYLESTAQDGERALVRNEGRYYSRPDADLTYTTAVVNNIAEAIYAQGELTITIPEEMGESSSHNLDFFGGEERSYQTPLHVPVDAPQRADLINDAFAQLQPQQAGITRVLRQLSEDTEGSPLFLPYGYINGMDFTHVPDGSEYPYLLAVEFGSSSAALFEASPSALIGPWEIMDYSGFGGAMDSSPQIACNDQALCLMVWSSSSGDICGVSLNIPLDPGETIDGCPLDLGEGFYPKVATDGKDFYVVFSEHTHLNGLAVSAQGETGDPWQLELDPSTGWGEATQFVDLAYAGSIGTYFVSWLRWEGGTPSPDYEYLNGATITEDGIEEIVAIATFQAASSEFYKAVYDPGLSEVVLAFNLAGHWPNPTGDLQIWSSKSEEWCSTGLDLGDIRQPVAFDNVRRSWFAATPEGEMYAFDSQCNPRTAPLQKALRDEYNLWLDCGAGECAMATVTDGKIYFDRFDIAEIPAAQGELNQTLVDKLWVDTDAPSIEFPAATIQLSASAEPTLFTLSGTASDPTSRIQQVQVMEPGGDWVAAAGTEAWAANISLPAGASEITVTVRAEDLFGRWSPEETVTIQMIDPPRLATDIQDGDEIILRFNAADNRWSLPIHGNVSDQGGGVVSVEVNVSPYSTGWQPAVLNGGTWVIEYILANFDEEGEPMSDPSGPYTFEVRALDDLGGVTLTPLSRTVNVAAAAPSAQITSIGGFDPLDLFVISEVATLQGTYTDAQAVEVSFTDIQTDPPTFHWQPADVDPVAGTWSFEMDPDAIPEGFYQIDVRGVYSGHDLEQPEKTWGQWRGLVDLHAPDVTLTVEPEGTDSTARTHYQLIASDLNLDGSRITFSPCDGIGVVTHEYYEDEWYLEISGDQAHLVGLTHTCTLSGFPEWDEDVVVYDLFDHATTLSILGSNQTPVAVEIIIEAGEDITSLEGDVVFLAPATFTAPESPEPFSSTIDWGDESPVEDGIVTNPSEGMEGVVEGSHTYTAAGIYSVEVCVMDGDGNSACDSLTVAVEGFMPEEGTEERSATSTTEGIPLQTLPASETSAASSTDDMVASIGSIPMGNDDPYPLDAFIFNPHDGSVLLGTAPIVVEGGANGSNPLQTLTLFVDSAEVGLVEWTVEEAVLDATWSIPWSPENPGTYALHAALRDWTGEEMQSEPISVIVVFDDQPPSVTIDPLTINRQDLGSSNVIPLTGTANSPAGIAEVFVSIDGGTPRPALVTAASPDSAIWDFSWSLSDDPAALEKDYLVTAIVTDTLGRQAEASLTIPVDVIMPRAVNFSLFADDEPIEEAWQTIRDVQELVIQWEESDDITLMGYLVGWTESSIPEATELTFYPSSDHSHSQPADEAKAWYAHVGVEDEAGNISWGTKGPIFVDALETPDYISDLSYHGWMESGCTLIGVDRQVSRFAPPSASLNAVQQFYTSWNSDALRFTWTGANWDSDGDLFIYLDTTSDGSGFAYSPYGSGQPRIGMPEGFLADFLVMVEDADNASLFHWSGSEWILASSLDASHFRLNTNLEEVHTDILLPFVLLGTPSTLRLVAFATEEESLRLWATMPDENPHSSPRVVNNLAAGLDVTGFNLVQEYSWLELGPGQCPKEGQFTDSDLEIRLAVDPEGIIANYMLDDWLTLTPGTSLDANHDGILEVLLPVDHEPDWLGTGDVITYTLSYANLGSETAEDVRVNLEAFGALSIPGGGTIFLDDISPERTGTVQFTARIIDNEDRSAELQVKVVDAAHGESNWLWALHLVDRDPPTDVVIHSPKNYVHSGPVAVSGEAQDASGLEEVVIQILGDTVCSDMDPENGAWTCLWEVPDGIDGQVFELEIYGTDLYGSTSVPVSTSVTLDNTNPVVELDQASLDALVDNILVPGEFTLSGIVEDNYQAVGVKLCISRDSGKKCVEVKSHPNDGQVSGWVYNLNPYPSDGAMETLEVFGLDAAGNQASEALTFEYEVDNLGPQIDVLTQRIFIWMGEEPVPILAGTVEDSHGVEEMFVSVRKPNAEMGWFGVDITDGQWEFSLTFEDPGPYLLRLYGRDGVGNVKGYGPYPVYYMIPSQTLQIEAGPDQVAVEGEEVVVAATFQDSNTQSTHTAIIDWGEGLPEAGTIDEGDGTGTVYGSHSYTNRGQYTVHICVSDQDGASACDSFTVQVKGQAPVVEAGEDQDVDEGDTVSLDPATFSYIASQAPYSAEIDWGDGTIEDGNVSQEDGLGTVAGSHIYQDQGVYVVKVTVTDVDGDEGFDTFVVTVYDLAPRAAFSWSPDPQNEGMLIQFTDESASYPDEIVGWAWDFGSQGTSSDQNPSFTFSDEGEFDVCLTVTDDDNSSDTICHMVMVTNAAPIVEADEDKVISEGEGIALENTTFRDTGSLDTHIATIDWGDDSPEEVGYVQEPQPGEDGSVEGSHVYGDNGTFTVTITVCDDEGDCGVDTFVVEVNNLSPTLTLDIAGVKHFAGGDAFLGRLGVPQTHEATAIDPGSDDLIFEWSFGVSHTYFNDGIGPDPFPSTGGEFPFQAIDMADVTFDAPGVQAITIEVLDDDGGLVSEDFQKIVTGDADWIRSRIYWLKQFSGRGRPQLDEATLQAYLDVVNFASRIFSEKVPASTIEEAREVLKISHHGIPGLVEAYLLTAWLNFASGAIDWDQPIYTHWKCGGGTTFHELLYQVEWLWLMRSATRFDFALLRGFILLKNLERGRMPGFCR